MLKSRNKSPVFAIALSLSLTSVYILHAYIVHIFICLIYLVPYCFMLGDCLLTLVFNQESHSGVETLKKTRF